MTLPKILKNFNLFLDGRGYVGKAEEVNLPKLTLKTEELRAGGMDAPVVIDLGLEKLEASFTIAEFDPEIFKRFGILSGNSLQFTLKGALVNDDTTTPLTVKLQGMYTELDMGKIAAGEKSSLQGSIACRYYKLEIDGKTLIEIDVDNMTRVIDGEDILADIRNALGI